MLQSSSKWNALEKISFRFVVIYFALHIYTFYISFLPYTTSLMTYLRGALQSIPVWFADKFLDIEITVFPNGSGDTTYNYIEVLVFFIIAILGCLIWSFLDRNRQSYYRLLRFFRIYVSYYVGAYMLSYGLSKIFYIQFSEPSFIELFRTYADSSPMGIAWTFMGASKSYTMFSGFAEFIGGLLLFHRRTRTFGALLVFAVMLNVFMMNMSYDIPVKLFSFHLMIMAIFIAALDYKRIFNLIIFKKAKNFSNEITPLFENRKLAITATILKFAFIGYALYAYTNSNYEYWKERNTGPKPHLYGVYETESFIKNSDTIAPLVNDKTRWNKLLVDKGYFSDYLVVKGMNNQTSWYEYKLDSVKKTLKMTRSNDSLDVLNLNYIRKDSMLSFNGLWKTDTIEINFKVYDLTKIRLMNRGFNWINEYPYNR